MLYMWNKWLNNNNAGVVFHWSGQGYTLGLTKLGLEWSYKTLHDFFFTDFCMADTKLINVKKLLKVFLTCQVKAYKSNDF